MLVLSVGSKDNFIRNDENGGGGWWNRILKFYPKLISHIHSNIPSKEFKLPKKYKAIVALAIEARLDNQDIIFIGIYWRPKILAVQAEHQHLTMVEDELNDIC